ncbi:MAG: hypothetical protein RBS37_11605, partial [Bacteroidales bacterium]|nr:hypothetical protein [Bacteroidales bacterium]
MKRQIEQAGLEHRVAGTIKFVILAGILKSIRELLGRSKILYLTLVLILVQAGVALSQTEIGGSNLNSLSVAVTETGTDYVKVTSVAGFTVGDTVLLIQMKGVRILTP